MRPLLLTWLVLLVLTGCKRAPESARGEEAGHDHAEAAPGQPDAHGHSHGHEEEAEAPTGASYKKGQGVLVKEETKKLLGLETVEVSTMPLARKVEFVAQAFPSGRAEEPTHWRASGMVPTTLLTGVKTGQEAALRSANGETFSGRVKSLDATLGRINGETEVLLEFPGPTASPSSVSFFHVTLTLPATTGVAVVPRSALLRTAEGAFVYAVNGEAYQRTAVKTGAESDALVEITDGLLEGDAVVTRPVEALYLVELRAVKGGGHSH